MFHLSSPSLAERDKKHVTLRNLTYFHLTSRSPRLLQVNWSLLSRNGIQRGDSEAQKTSLNQTYKAAFKASQSYQTLHMGGTEEVKKCYLSFSMHDSLKVAVYPDLYNSSRSNHHKFEGRINKS